MHRSTLLAGLVGVALAFEAAPAHAILGGVDDANDPAVVAVSMPVFGAYCSGALVAPRLVLTAGHCLAEKPSKIVIGADEDDGTSVAVIGKAAHPQYTKEGADFDLAVLILDHDVEGVTPLTTSHTAIDASLVGKDVRHVGFGTTEDGNVFGIGTKHTVTYPVTNVDATKVYSGTDTKNTLDGDSGSPTLFAGPDGVERIIAVVSDGPTDGPAWDIRVDLPEVTSWLDPLIAQYGGAPIIDAPDAGSPTDTGPTDDVGAVAPPSSSVASDDAGTGGDDHVPHATSSCAAGGVGAPPMLVAFAIAFGMGASRRVRRRT